MDNQINSPSNSTIPVVEPTENIPQKTSKKVILITLGILELPFPALALYLLFPLLSVQNTLETNIFGSYVGLFFFLFALLIALTQIIFGFLSYDLKIGNKRTKFLIMLGLITAALTIPAIMLTIIMPIYSTVESVQ